jgi:hypothetical protein
LVAAVRAGWVSYSLGVALAAVVAALVAAMLVARIWLPNRWRRRAFSIAAFGAGVGVPLLARIVTDGHSWASFAGLGTTVATVGVMLIPVALAVGAGLLAREFGDDLPRQVVTIAWGLALASAVAVAIWMLSREGAGDHFGPLLWCAGLVGLIVLGYLVDGWLGKASPRSRWWVGWAHRIRGPFLFFLAAAWIALLITFWSRHDRAAIALLVTFAAVAHVPVFLGFAYYMHRISANGRFWVAFTYGVFLAGVVALTVFTGSEWVLRFLGGLVCVALILLALTVGAYLYWARGFALLRHRDARAGVLDPEELGSPGEPGSRGRRTIEADAFLAWNEACRPRQHSLTKRVHAIGTIVYPSRRKDVRSPLHQALSEIFEPQQPPMYKSFLRVDVLEDEVKITCFGVEGFDEKATVVDTIHLDLPS